MAVNMLNRDNVKWFVNGTYQGGTDREFKAIHIYDIEKRVIAIFKKDIETNRGRFVTTCELDDDENKELFRTGNFGGGKDWFSGKVKNLLPKQTVVDTFENDIVNKSSVTKITSIDEVSNPGFTPISSFENDIMNVTPIDNSQFDNP